MSIWEAGSNLRGTLPGAYFPHQGRHFPDFQMLDNIPGFPGRKFIGARLSSSNNALGDAYMSFDLGNWR